MTELMHALDGFISRYRINESLCADMRGWHCTICLETTDANDCVRLNIEDGQVSEIVEGPSSPRLTVRSERQILLDVLQFRLDPNQPYLFGELTIEGNEDDFLRLDYVVTRLCER